MKRRTMLTRVLLYSQQNKGGTQLAHVEALKQSTGETILDALRIHAARRGDRIAFTFLKSNDEQSSVTYRDLNRRAKEIAGALLEVADPGDRALLMYPSGLEFIEAFLGCLYAGIIAVPAYPPVKNRNAERIIAIARDCKPRLLLCSSESRKNVECELSELGASSKIVETDKIVNRYNRPLPQLKAEGIAFLQYTSGSTSAPKGVEVTHENLLANEKAIQDAFKLNADSVIVSWLPMFHDLGLIVGVLSPLFVGYRSVLMSPNTFLRDPVVWLQAVTNFRATLTGAPNFAFELCIKGIASDQKKNLDLSTLSITFNGAEPVRAETLLRFGREFSECGFRNETWLHCYGLAESTLLVSCGRPFVDSQIISVDSSALENNKIKIDSNGQKLVSCGTIGHSELEIRIVCPESFAECRPGEVGEIWLRGASVSKGYWNRPVDTSTVFQAKLAGDTRDWFRTSDYGFVRDGELYVTGRLNDLIIIRGRNIYPQDIELTVEKLFDFVKPNSCAAFSLQIDGEECLAVVIEADRNMVRWANNNVKYADSLANLMKKTTALRAAILDSFGVFLKEIVFVRPATFPRTSSGKVQRQLCRRLLQENKLVRLQVDVSAGHELNKRVESPRLNKHCKALQTETQIPPEEKNDLFLVVAEAIRNWANREGISLTAIDRDIAFCSLPLDSVATVDIITRIEKSISVRIQPGILFQCKTVGDLVDYLAESKSACGTERASTSLRNHPHAVKLPNNEEDYINTTTPLEKESPDSSTNLDNSSRGSLLYNFQLMACLVTPTLLAAVAALSPLFFLSSRSILVMAFLLSPTFFLMTYLIVCCCLGRCYSRQIEAGQFIRSTLHKKYRYRRLYGACWCTIYYFGPLYNLILSLPGLKKFVFRNFGYSGNFNWSIYPDTWIRDLPLLHIGENAYVANKATLGTNLPLKNGQILVDHIRIGMRSMIGHLAMVGAGTEIGSDVVIGHGSAVGIYSCLGDRVSIGPRASLDSFVHVGEDCSIGMGCVIHQGVAISAGLIIHPSSHIPKGVTISSQQEADAYAPSQHS